MGRSAGSRVPAPIPDPTTSSAGNGPCAVAYVVTSATPVGVASSPWPPASTATRRPAPSTAGTGTGSTPVRRANSAGSQGHSRRHDLVHAQQVEGGAGPDDVRDGVPGARPRGTPRPRRVRRAPSPRPRPTAGTPPSPARPRAPAARRRRCARGSPPSVGAGWSSTIEWTSTFVARRPARCTHGGVEPHRLRQHPVDQPLDLGEVGARVDERPEQHVPGDPGRDVQPRHHTRSRHAAHASAQASIRRSSGPDEGGVRPSRKRGENRLQGGDGGRIPLRNDRFTTAVALDVSAVHADHHPFDQHVHPAAGGHHRVRVRRVVRRAVAEARGRRHHPHRPHHQPPVPAAALPGGDRHPLRGRDRPGDAGDPPQPAQRDDDPRRRDGHRHHRPDGHLGQPGPHRGHALRHADPRRRFRAVLLRQRPVRPVRAGDEGHRRRPRAARAGARQLRAGRAGGDPRRQAGGRPADVVRGRRRRPDRGRDGRPDRRAVQADAEARLPAHRPDDGPDHPPRRRAAGAAGVRRPPRRDRPAAPHEDGRGRAARRQGRRHRLDRHRGAGRQRPVRLRPTHRGGGQGVGGRRAGQPPRRHGGRVRPASRPTAPAG